MQQKQEQIILFLTGIYAFLSTIVVINQLHDLQDFRIRCRIQKMSGVVFNLIDEFGDDKNIEIKDSKNSLDPLLAHLFRTNKMSFIIVSLMI